jgi:hypothetical protein
MANSEERPSLGSVIFNGETFVVYPDGSIVRSDGSVAVQTNNGLGYLRVTSRGKKIVAHRLVWMARNGKIPDGLQIDHINGVKHDNRIENLRAVTPSENTIFYHRMAGCLVGKRKLSRGRLSADEVREIRGLINNGVPRISIAKRFRVTRSCIRHICTGKNHANT